MVIRSSFAFAFGFEAFSASALRGLRRPRLSSAALADPAEFALD
jgi:hypothetical protein